MILNEITFDISKIAQGSTIALVGYAVVFAALVVLYLIFYYLPKLMRMITRMQLRKQGKADIAEKDLDISGEVNAAISMALYMHFNQIHDHESNVITIKRVAKVYSPWSSKIWVVRNIFNRN